MKEAPIPFATEGRYPSSPDFVMRRAFTLDSHVLRRTGRNGAAETDGASRDTHGAKAASNGHTPEKVAVTAPVIPAVTQESERRVGAYQTFGEIGVTGVAIAAGPELGSGITATVRSPRWVRTDDEKARPIQVEWGGKPQLDHIEVSFLKPYGTEAAAEVARDITEAARDSVHYPYEASVRGHEVESFLTNFRTGRIEAAGFDEQEELQSGVWEIALAPQNTIEDAMKARARHAIIAVEEWADDGILPVNTSVPISGFPDNDGLTINNGKYEHYVAGMSNRLLPLMGRHDDHSGQVGDAVASMYGYDSLEAMVDGEPNVAYWVAAAGHQSTSLPHIENVHGDYEVPTEIAIAAGDMLNSDMAKVAGLLMFSSPMLFGETPVIKTEKGERTARDYRDIYRRIMATSIPGDMIRDPKTLDRRILRGIVEGETHTMDRTAYRAEGMDTPSYHGPVRLRMAQPESGKPIGRVEVTEAGSSFSLLDYYAFQVMVDVMKLGAFEAVAAGQHPSDYFGERFSTLRDSKDRVAIGDGYNLFGGEDPKAAAAIQQAYEFMGEMADKYPPQAKNIRFAQERIANLLADTPARNFDEYMENPQGQVTEVMRHMREDGASPAQIAVAVTKYEYQLAHKILEADGDVTEVYAKAA